MKLQSFIISILSLYQRVCSPDHSFLRVLYPYGYCRYYPTCSEYAKHACMKYGGVRGSIIAIKRVLRCNPWSKGGIDFIS